MGSLDIPKGHNLHELFKDFKSKELKWFYKKEGKRARHIFQRGGMIGHRIYSYHILDRTMDEAKRYVDTLEKQRLMPYSGAVFLAQMLLCGHGRYTRPWYAPKGGLWYSILLYPEVGMPYFNLYPLAVGIACCEALSEMKIPVHLKWVNDLMVNGKKLGGILSETYYAPVSKDPYLIFGIGINVNNTDFPISLKDKAISIRQILGKEVDLNTLFIFTLTKLIWYIGLLHYTEVKGDSQPIIKTWTNYTDSIKRNVIHGEDLEKSYGTKAKVTGINSDGSLTLELPQRREQIVYSGEIIYCE